MIAFSQPVVEGIFRWALAICFSVACGVPCAVGDDDPYQLTYQKVANQQHYDQPWRPQFHYTPLQGHIGDATGLIYYKGQYHLFYMYDKWELRRHKHKQWGHAVSYDLVHWEERPAILDTLIDNRPGSGSGVVDWNNSAGLAQGPENTLLVFYTDYGRGSSIALSRDAGKSWSRYQNNPVLAGTEDIRDPTVFWYEPDKSWRMVRYEQQGFAFYRSSDLLKWDYLSRIEGFYECPDILHLPVEGQKGESKWVLYGGNHEYLLGQFDGTTFVPDSPEKLQVDFSGRLYAAQTWRHTRYEGRAIQMAWVRYPWEEGTTQTLTWNGQQCFPCELTLKELPEGIRLCRQPIEEIKNLHRQQFAWSDRTIAPGENLLADCKFDICEVLLDIDLASASQCRLTLGSMVVRYDVEQQRLECGDHSLPFVVEANRLKLQLLVDTSSIELFAGEGQLTFTEAYFHGPDVPRTMALETAGGPAHIHHLEINYLHSIWKPRLTISDRER